MKKIVVLTLSFLLLIAVSAWGLDAVDFYNHGLQNSLSYKKIEYFTKALLLDPKMVDAYEHRGLHFYFQRRFDQAIEDYDRVIELKPDGMDAYRMRGMSYLQKAHRRGMIAEIKRLIHRHLKPGVPEDGDSLVRAIHDFSRAIELDPETASAYSYRAEAYRLNGKTDEAMRDAASALQMNGDQISQAKAFHVMSLIYRSQGQDELYADAYRRFVDLAPWAPDFPPLNVPIFSKTYMPGSENMKAVRFFGLVGIIVVSFALIFQIVLRTPTKNDKSNNRHSDNT